MIPEYTPIILNVNGIIIIKQVGELLNGKYSSKVEERNNKTVEYYDLELFNIKLWSDYDFTRLIGIKKVFFGNHKSNHNNQIIPKFYRIFTDNGLVDVCENQILLQEKVDDDHRTYIQETSVKEVKVGDTLVHCIAKNQTINAKEPENSFLMKNPTQITAAKALNFFQNNRLLSFNFYIDINENNNYIFKVPENNLPRTNKIIKIIEINYEQSFAYEVITENTHFAAGIGNIIL
mgnify:CR=1 FL=1